MKLRERNEMRDFYDEGLVVNIEVNEGEGV